MSIIFPNHWEPVSPTIDPEEWIDDDDEEQWTKKQSKRQRNAPETIVKFAEARRFHLWRYITESYALAAAKTRRAT